MKNIARTRWASAYSSNYENYLRLCKQGELLTAPNSKQLHDAMTKLGIHALIFVSKFPWFIPGYGSKYAMSIPKLGQVYVSWDGVSFVALRLAAAHELCEVFSYSDSLDKPLVTDCAHRGCLMNQTLDGCSMKLHQTHIRVLDRDNDGAVSCHDLGHNSDNKLKVSIVISGPVMASPATIIAEIRSGLITGLQIIDPEKLRIGLMQIDELLALTLDARYYD